MKEVSLFSYVFRRYPLARAALVILFCAALFALFSVFSLVKREVPQVSSINPQVAHGGSLISLTGKAFGKERSDSYVELSGFRLLPSLYVSWSNEKIEFKIPEDVEGAIVKVKTKNGKSNPVFFVNDEAIPKKVNYSMRYRPEIYSFEPKNVAVGEIFRIKGKHFGNKKGQVFFASSREETELDKKKGNEALPFVECTEIEEWDEEEIKLRVPDGAVSGEFFVMSSLKSNLSFLKIEDLSNKRYVSPRNYSLHTEVSVDLRDADEESYLLLRVPRPMSVASNYDVNVVSLSEEAIHSDFNSTILYRLKGKKGERVKKNFAQDFMLRCYEINTEIEFEKIGSYKNTDKAMWEKYTAMDLEEISLSKAELKDLAAQAAGNEKNPAKIAKAVYDFMTKKYTLLPNARAKDAKISDLKKYSMGDAWDFAHLYAAILRERGVMCALLSGVLVKREGGRLTSQAHWWNMVYLPSCGWIPVDTAMGALGKREYYFGNQDNRHVLFSLGVNQIKSSADTNTCVCRRRSYALQSVWEEASAGLSSYSCYWSEVEITGLY